MLLLCALKEKMKLITLVSALSLAAIASASDSQRFLQESGANDDDFYEGDGDEIFGKAEYNKEVTD